MLDILGMIILIIILIIIILLASGIKIKFEYKKHDNEIKGCLKILILKKIKIYTHEFPSANEKNNKPKEENKKKNPKKLLNLLKPCIKDLLNFIKTLIQTLKITKIENHIIFGMDSYADTGKYIGIIWAVLAVINPMNKNLKITAEPSFTGTRLDAEGTNDFEIYPFKILIPTIQLLLKKDIRKLIRGVLDER